MVKHSLVEYSDCENYPAVLLATDVCVRQSHAAKHLQQVCGQVHKDKMLNYVSEYATQTKTMPTLFRYNKQACNQEGGNRAMYSPEIYKNMLRYEVQHQVTNILSPQKNIS